MKRKLPSRILFSGALLLLLLVSYSVVSFFIVKKAYAYSTNQGASLVVGQPDLSSGLANQGGGVSSNGLFVPFGVITVGDKLVVSDYFNNRVLIYNSVPTSNNASADVVIGQPDMTSSTADQGGAAAANTLDRPVGLGSDGTKLFIADYGNNRVLVYNTLPTSNNASADVVIGQPDMTTVTCVTSQTRFCTPHDIAYDAVTQKLVIGTYNNRRVLVYNTIPVANGAAADVVVDEVNFTSTTSATDQSSVAQVTNLRVFDGKLLVSDGNKNRVLVWNTIPTTNKTPADYVIGQPDFTSSTCNVDGTEQTASATTLCYPSGIAYDGRWLFISDTGNSRVLIYDGLPTANTPAAVQVIGQQDLTTVEYNPVSAQTIATGDSGLHIYNNQLIVADPYFNRVVFFENLVPEVSNVQAAPTETTATITWDTNVPSSSQVEYGLDGGLGIVTAETDTAPQVTDHTIEISGLVACTEYFYQVTSRDEVDQSDTSGLLSFTTLCPSPTPSPSPSVSPSPEPSVTPSPSPVAHVGGFSPPQPPPPPPACHLQRPPGAPDLYQVRTLGDTATLHFTPVGNPQDHYLILYGTAQHPWEHNTFLYTQDRSGALSITIDDLQPGLTYFFTIRAGNGCSAGDWSNVLESTVTGKSWPILNTRVK